jgi:thiol-disulfide isomerase/thioredoxin
LSSLLLYDTQMKKILPLFLAVILSAPSISQLKNNHEISITISGLRDSSVYLAYHFGDKQYLKDTVKLDSRGRGVFSGPEKLPQGIYMIVLPGKQYFEFLASDDQVFSIYCNYNDYYNTLKFTGSDENTSFIEYQKKWMSLQKQAQAISRRMQANKQNSDSLKILGDMQKSQEESMKSYLRSVISANGNNLLAMLVKSMLPVEIPEFKIPAGTHNPDSVSWVRKYNYNKDHFFDNIDLSDERILRTPILYARLETFFTNVVIQYPDSVNREIDKIIKKCEPDHKVFQFVSVFLFNHFRESEIMGQDAVMVKLADDIYLSGKADWTTKEFRDDLARQVELLRNNLIGMKAKDLVMDSYSGRYVSLYDVDKDFIILYFWEPNCGHCKEATPKLKAYYEKVKDQGIEVFAVCTISDKEVWSKYIQENNLTWINGWDPDRKTNFDFYYNVQSTPMIYILDRNKKIIAKKLSVDDIPSFIENYRKYNM